MTAQRRIYIVGIVGAGKTTMARELSAALGLPHHELDCIVHGDDSLAETGGVRIKRTPEEQAARLREIDGAGGWVIEGTYRESCRLVLDCSDEIIFLDPPLRIRLWRIVARWVRQRMGREHCHYHPSIKMLRLMFKWTLDFEHDRPAFRQMLEPYGGKLRLIRNAGEYLDNGNSMILK